MNWLKNMLAPYPKYKIAQDRSWDLQFTAKVKYSWRDGWEPIERESRPHGSMSRYRPPEVTYASLKEAEIAVEAYHARFQQREIDRKIKEATPRYSGEYKVRGHGIIADESGDREKMKKIIDRFVTKSNGLSRWVRMDSGVKLPDHLILELNELYQLQCEVENDLKMYE